MDPTKLLRMRGYWEEADEDGGKGGGGDEAPIDRGDEITDDKAKDDDTKDDADAESGGEGDEGGDGAEKTAAKTKTSDDAKGEGEDDDGGKPKDADEDASGKDPLIPKHRFDYKNRKLKEAQTRVQELEKLLAESKEGRTEDKTPKEKDLEEEIEELNKKYADALKDDDVDAQREINSEIQKKLVQQIKQIKEAASIDPSDIRKQVIDSLSMNEMIDAVEAKFSVLNEDSKDFDPDLSEEILDMFDTLNNSGKYESSAMALARSVELIMGEPVVAEEAADKDAGKRSTKTNIDKNLETAKKQPPAADKVKNSESGGLKDDVETSKLSEEEFDALPESTKKRLRGDFV